jgi:hypothetical protein
MARFGRLTPTQVFGFVPALALGGAEELKYVQPVDIKVHMAILRALYGA